MSGPQDYVPWKLSRYGRSLLNSNAIENLMTDLTSPRTSGRIMLGGGSPAIIPELLPHWQRVFESGSLQRRLTDEVSLYSAAAGLPELRATLAELLRTELAWPVQEDQILIFPGSQLAFDTIVRIFHSPDEPGSLPVYLPFAPEYIGYDTGLPESSFIIRDCETEYSGNTFRYLPGSADLPDCSLVLVSFPANPTGRTLPETVLNKLYSDCRKKNIPLLIDMAYGGLFPGLVYNQSTIPYADDVIYSMSFSKAGLPGLRLSFLIAPRDLVRFLDRSLSRALLSVSGASQAIALYLIKETGLAQLSSRIIKPVYHDRLQSASAILDEYLTGLYGYLRHQTEGGFFQWIVFEDLPVSHKELYYKLRNNGLIIVPGHPFFYPQSLRHGEQRHTERHMNGAVRLNASGDTAEFRKGISILRDSLRSSI